MIGTRSRAARGFTLVEVAIATAIASGLLLVGSVMAVTMREAGTASLRRTAMADQAASATDRMARELQIAGFAGEDENGNGVLDPGEDANVNGRLDADWDLPDGATANGVTFNVSRGWDWSGPIAFRVVDGVLRREEAGAVLELARGVQELSITRAGRGVRIRIVLGGTDGAGEVWTDFAERNVHVRN